MSDQPVVIDLWRALIHIAVFMAGAFVADIVIAHVFASHDWLFEPGYRGFSPAGIMAICVGGLAGWLLHRVFPLVPRHE